MAQKVLVIIGFFLVGLLATSGLYLLLTGQRIEIISPLGNTRFSFSKPPSEALVGKIASLSGSVLWESRTAATPSAIANPQPLQQGEEVDTGKNGTATIMFESIASVVVSHDTGVAIIQTLPVNIVLDQKMGEATYHVLPTAIPFSVRGLDLLIQPNGTCVVAVDDRAKQVLLSVIKGSARIAYTDTKYVTVVKTISARQKALFTNDTKTISVF